MEQQRDEGFVRLCFSQIMSECGRRTTAGYYTVVAGASRRFGSAEPSLTKSGPDPVRLCPCVCLCVSCL